MYSIFNQQWGFMQYRTSLFALITVIRDCLNALDNGLEACVVIFDHKKALDSVPQAPLLEKLAEIGLNLYIIHWIKAIPHDQKLFVVVDGSSSALNHTSTIRGSSGGLFLALYSLCSIATSVM